MPGLETRLRDKKRESEDAAAMEGKESKDCYLDLEGVTCEPTAARNRTLWNFHCDGATYPAKLVNLPCPVELHKTHDHAAYFKCSDIAQMLIVYEDDMALEEAEEKAIEGFPSYHHSGLTPPMKRVVERRFAAREQKAVAPPRAAVVDVEDELLQLMDKISKDEKTKRNKLPSLTSASKILEEVVEEVVDYETWMDDYGRDPDGVEFDASDHLCSQHPEVWLSPDLIRAIKDEDEAAKRKRKESSVKKEAKRKERKSQEEAAKHTKKGIASKKNTEAVDDVTQAAASMLAQDFDLMGAVVDDDDFFGDLGDLGDLGINTDDMNLDGL